MHRNPPKIYACGNYNSSTLIRQVKPHKRGGYDMRALLSTARITITFGVVEERYKAHTDTRISSCVHCASKAHRE
jgi:hypothetical protein